MSKKNQVISLVNYRKKKQLSQRTSKAASDNEFFVLDEKPSAPTTSSVYYMSNYLKTKEKPFLNKERGKILDFSAHKSEGASHPSRFNMNAEEPISLNDYRKSKEEKTKQQVSSRSQSWAQSALSVSAVAVLAMFLAFGVLFQKQKEGGLDRAPASPGKPLMIPGEKPSEKYKGY